jgi:hypothetical protein
MDKGYSPPPTLFPSNVEQTSKTLDKSAIDVSQQLFNIDSTTTQHPDPVESSQNGHKPYQTNDTAHNKISQQLSESKGEREVVKPSTSNDVLYNPEQESEGEGGKNLFLPLPSSDVREKL